MTPGFPTLAARNRQPELMDQPGLDERLHGDALRSLSRINVVSRTSAMIWEPIRHSRFETRPARPLRILDVACGGGDVALGLARLANRAGVAVHIDGCDINAVAVAHASDAADRQKITNVGFFQHDALKQPLPDGYDIVTCSLFLHHLDDSDAGLMFRSMAAAATQMVVASDLRRSRLVTPWPALPAAFSRVLRLYEWTVRYQWRRRSPSRRPRSSPLAPVLRARSFCRVGRSVFCWSGESRCDRCHNHSRRSQSTGLGGAGDRGGPGGGPGGTSGGPGRKMRTPG